MRLLVACSACVFYVLVAGQLVAHASTNTISVNKLSIEVVDRAVRVDCEVRYRIEDSVRTALSNGIELYFTLELELMGEREFLPDSSVAEMTRQFRIKYHALSDQYVLIDVDDGKERSFPQLHSALFSMGQFQGLVVADLDTLQLDKRYYVRARARLVSEKLPLPLRVKSYFSPDWRPSSGWTLWPM